MIQQHVLYDNYNKQNGKIDKIYYASGIHGEHSESKGGVYDISNKRRMGLSEIEAVQEMRRGVEKIIDLEKKLASGGKI